MLCPQPELLPTAPASETNVLDPQPELRPTAPASETNVLDPQPELRPTAPASEANVLDPRPELPRTAPAPGDTEAVQFVEEPQTAPGGLARDDEPMDSAGTNDPPEASQGTTLATTHVNFATLPKTSGKSSSQFRITYHNASIQQFEKGRLKLVSVTENGKTYETSDLQKGADSSLRSIERIGNFCFSYDREHRRIKIKPLTDLNSLSCDTNGPVVLYPEARSKEVIQAVREVERRYKKRSQRRS